MPRFESSPPPDRRPRVGCFGNLARLAAVLLLVGALMLVTTAVFAPWGFFLGGNFHIIPYWQGWGRLHSSISGDYVVFVQLEPRPPTRLGSAYFGGVGCLCTPRGERIRLTLNALMGRHLKRSTDGEAISFHMYNRPAFTSIFDPERRPRIDLRGHWRNPNLVVDDEGSIAHGFLKDGRVNLGAWPASKETISFTIAPGSWSDFEEACSARD